MTVPGLRHGRLLVSFLLLFLAVQMNVRLDQMEPVAGPPRHSLFLPSGKYLRFAALGFRSLLADVLYVWSIQYYSEERENRWAHLGATYDAIAELDPRFISAYSIGALILSLEAGSRDAALRLLDKGIAANPGTYVLAWEAAFYARDAGDLEGAAKYLTIASSRPDAPDFVRRWRATLADRLGDAQSALAMWAEIYDTARSDYEREVAARWIHDLTLHILLDRVRGGVIRFHQQRGQAPSSLEELARAGLADGPFADVNGHLLHYDRKTGEVAPSCGFLLQHRVKQK